MKNAKLKYVLQIAVLLLLTAVILCAVVRIERAVPASAETDATASASSAAPQDVNGLQTATELQTEQMWLPEIEYDDYTPSAIAQENFHSTVILGNSQAQALSNYGLIRDADFVTRIGLSINQVLTSKSGDPPIRQLYGKQYSKAVFIFGENELGWPYPKNFVLIYKNVIEKVRELNPGVEIYCQAIFPVSAECSETSTNGITNENVRLFNAAIKEMCDEIGAHYMPVSDAFFDRDGVLPADAAKDGVHFNYDYCKIWAGDLSAYLQDETPDATEKADATDTTDTTDTTETIDEGVTLE